MVHQSLRALVVAAFEAGERSGADKEAGRSLFGTIFGDGIPDLTNPNAAPPAGRG